MDEAASFLDVAAIEKGFRPPKRVAGRRFGGVFLIIGPDRVEEHLSALVEGVGRVRRRHAENKRCNRTKARERP